MSTKIAFLFPGQGSQAVGMGCNLAERFPIAAQTFAEADEALGFSLSKLIFEGPETDLRLTENTQPAILTVSVAAWRVLREHGIEPALAAGHSCVMKRTSQQLTITAEQPGRAGFHCTRNPVTAEDSMPRMASNSPVRWL